ncbi:hypothetical protein PS673_02020 [Pseudomonas fluorescens]|jgi:hypothetical protein|uniref:Tyr recombinase domain-containing protein n=1 Tax=Pseudomonas fluorescens TaxID=294 RepID=A0A5E6SEY6_PSEFL|nr:site-specific integrase [Pseudomonas fluorescens]VVM75905.1 hypothetical protein PS673_02020 [Pseudomonas fluorescens]
MADVQTAPICRYHKVVLKNVKLWEPCSEEEATEWLAPQEEGNSISRGYPIRPMRLQPPSAPRLYVIVQPDGALWLEGCLYLFWCWSVKGIKDSTASNAAGDLCDMMNKLESSERDYNVFRGPKSERPTYFYKSELKLEIARGTLKRKTANRKITNCVGLYTWKLAYRNFKPEAEMWQEQITQRRYTDKYGVMQVREVQSTDLSFKNKNSISTGRFIRDGGKLYPISRENQKILLDVLAELKNVEMLLMHIVSLTTGFRIQSVLTLRHSSILCGVGSDDDPNKYALYPIDIGEGTLVEAKNSKEQVVLMPAWVHRVLHVYISSQRHKTRSALSPITDDASQYVFLTRTGRPYYVAEADQSIFNFSAEKGSAIRQFAKKIKEKLEEADAYFSYQFHDLRATFGMNLLEDYMKKVKGGKMNQIELLDKLRGRLNHEDVNVTLGYLRYREDHPHLAQAQSEIEAHLEDLIRTEISKHDKSRALNLRT